jgi:hypothetical protein
MLLSGVGGLLGGGLMLFLWKILHWTSVTLVFIALVFFFMRLSR